MYSEYFSLSSESCAPHKSCHAIPRKWCGIPLRTKSCFIREPKGKMCNCNISDRLYVCTYVSCEGGKQKNIFTIKLESTLYQPTSKFLNYQVWKQKIIKKNFYLFLLLVLSITYFLVLLSEP